MKKLNILFLLIVIALSFNGCYDLDRYSQDQLSTATFWKTDEQANQGIIPVYASLKNGYAFGIIWSMDCVSDIGWGYDDNVGLQSIIQNSFNANTGHVKARWQHTYDAIKKANDVIRNLNSSQTVSVDVKNKVIAEAKFMRALLYFHLTNFFGGVPIYDETVDYDADYMNLTSSRSTEEEVRTFILSDLTSAIEYLPVKWDNANYGRATKGAAYALRGKVHLYQKQYAEASQDFEEIVLDPNNLGYGYELNPDYASLFTQEGHASNEMIFSIQNYLAVGFQLGMGFGLYVGNQSTFGFGWNNVLPSVNLVDSYELKNGKTFDWDDFIPGYNESPEVRKEVFVSTLSEDKKTIVSYPKYYNDLLAMYDQRDPRMQQTIILPYTHYLAGNPKVRDTELIYAAGAADANGFPLVSRYNFPYVCYLYRKFVPEGDMDGQLTQKSDRLYTPINFPLIRYADVLLMLAESYNGQGKIDNAVKYINMVRARSGMALINNGSTWMEARTQDAVLERIKHERAVELALEGHRYIDLRRWNVLDKALSQPITDVIGVELMKRQPFSEQHLYWPIPAEAIDKNPNLEQNPGW